MTNHNEVIASHIKADVGHEILVMKDHHVRLKSSVLQHSCKEPIVFLMNNKLSLKKKSSILEVY
jgi:hypothetical protein